MIANTTQSTAKTIPLIAVKTFILWSKVLPLFLDKNVSVCPPKALMPEEFPGWNRTTIMMNKALSAIMTSKIYLITLCHTVQAALPFAINI